MTKGFPGQLAFGITLSNRGVVLGTRTPKDLLDLADAVEANPLLDSVWVGDALYVNRRLDAVALLAAVAGRTQRILLGPAAMGSFALRNPLVFAYEWASIDQIANGRTRLIVAAGGGGEAAWSAESAALGVAPAQRRKRMYEHIRILKHLWRHDRARFAGDFYQFSDLVLEPKPANPDCPIWTATNATRLSSGAADAASGGSDYALRQCALLADGWMTHSASPEAIRQSWCKLLSVAAEAGRDPSRLDNCIYHHIHIDDDRDRALHQAKVFLDRYYAANYTRERLETWLTYGSARDCIEGLRAYRGSGAHRIALRLSSETQERRQFDLLVNEVLPYVNEGAPAFASAA
ncbi:MAG: LLM class flavin-dependent oxidoreductase [Burkholderiales bacterium]|nr:LLM class flavin-dependent oxidoreductase [Burkholderiales bacterium]